MKKAKRRVTTSDELNITSMMDMFTIILVFLLKSYSSEDVSVAASADMELPVSSALQAPKLAVNVVVTKTKILVDGAEVLGLGRIADEQNPGNQLIAVPAEEKKGQMITRLFDRLQEKAATAKSIAEASGREELAFEGEILIQCDKTLPFAVVREVMYTAGQAQFSKFRFVVYKSAG